MRRRRQNRDRGKPARDPVLPPSPHRCYKGGFRVSALLKHRFFRLVCGLRDVRLAGRAQRVPLVYIPSARLALNRVFSGQFSVGNSVGKFATVGTVSESLFRSVGGSVVSRVLGSAPERPSARVTRAVPAALRQR